MLFHFRMLAPRLLAALCLCGLASATQVFAQAPAISSISPQAVRPGTTGNLTVNGSNLAGVTNVWASFPGEIALAPDVKDNGKNKAQVVYRTTVPADAPVGVHGIRVATPQGVSALRMIVVDDLASVASNNANKTRQTAQKLELPIAVDGKIDALARNYYQFTAKAGQIISFEVVARRMGSALDPLLRLLDANGRELTYSDDAPGLSGDAQICHTFPADGQYTLVVRDIRFQGGANHNYRLRIGDFPCISAPYPMAARRGQPVEFAFAGIHINNVQPTKLTIPSDSGIQWYNVGAKRNGGTSSGFATVVVGTGHQAHESEPNNEPGQANRIELGHNVNGRFQQPGDSDRFVFSAKKGQKMTFEAVTRSLGSAADLYLQIQNKDGGKLAEVDDSGTNDGKLSFTFPSDGDFLLYAEDLHKRGGDQFAYHVAVSEATPKFKLTASADRINIPTGAAALITVTSAREGYNGPIQVSVDQLPKGTTCTPTVIGPGRNSVVLTLQAAADAPAGQLTTARVVGQGLVGESPIKATASISGAIKAGANNMPWAPSILSQSFAVGLAPRPPISLRTEPATLVFGRNLTAKVKVIAERQKGYDEAITLAVTPAKNGLPGGISVAVKPIPKGANEVELVFSANEKAPLGDFTATLNGVLKKGKTTVNQVVPGVGLKLTAPFSVSADTGNGELAKGQKLNLKVAVQRNPAFTGPLTLSVQNLPKGVTAAAATVAADKNEATIELTAAADAAAAQVKNLQVKADGMAGKAKLSATSAAVNLTIK